MVRLQTNASRPVYPVRGMAMIASKAEVDELMRLAEEADAEDIPDGMSLPKDLGEVDTLVADTGYFSEKNVILAIKRSSGRSWLGLRAVYRASCSSTS